MSFRLARPCFADKDVQFQDVRQNFYGLADPVFATLERVKENDKLAVYAETFITRISAASCALRGPHFKEHRS